MSEFTDGEPTLPFGGDVDIDAAIAAARCAGDAAAIAKLMQVRDARPAGWRGESPADASQCCQVCFDELGAKPAVQFPCAHWMCRMCAHTYTQENLTFPGCVFIVPVVGAVPYVLYRTTSSSRYQVCVIPVVIYNGNIYILYQ
jgi:hypothetical protein